MHGVSDGKDQKLFKASHSTRERTGVHSVIFATVSVAAIVSVVSTVTGRSFWAASRSEYLLTAQNQAGVGLVKQRASDQAGASIRLADHSLRSLASITRFEPIEIQTGRVLLAGSAPDVLP